MKDEKQPIHSFTLWQSQLNEDSASQKITQIDSQPAPNLSKDWLQTKKKPYTTPAWQATPPWHIATPSCNH
ncbi:hypothetical protein SynBIOSE41_00953 [Synechococcus sp. BIOS-E4-1]|nr:hypothetical protein SynBIOSE41_00953 [Synechococcus sp. BIOS-E4-1]